MTHLAMDPWDGAVRRGTEEIELSTQTASCPSCVMRDGPNVRDYSEGPNLTHGPPALDPSAALCGGRGGPTGRRATSAFVVRCRCGALCRRLVLVLPWAALVERGARSEGLAVFAMQSTDAPPSLGRAGGADVTRHLGAASLHLAGASLIRDEGDMAQAEEIRERAARADGPLYLVPDEPPWLVRAAAVMATHRRR
jgi:hypothetical protein